MYVTVFYTLIISRVAAQNVDTLIFHSHAVRSVGGGVSALNYSLLSPLKHSGYSLGFLSVRFREKPEYITQFKIHLEFGLLYNDANDSYITSLGVNSGWLRHWHVGDSELPLRLLVGAGADIGLNAYMKEDNTNNPMAYFLNLSVSPGILLKYRFTVKKARFDLGQQIEVPLGSLISSSDYSSSLPLGISEKEVNFIDAIRFVTFGSLKKCVTVTTVDITPFSQRRQRLPVFRINYTFSGMNYKNNDFTVNSAGHLIVFGAIFRLFR